jgi:ribonuclease III
MHEVRARRNDRAFKVADLVSLIYRYIPPNTIVRTDESQLPVFETAFSHRSAGRESSYERMEFLGDAINTAVLSTYIYRRFGNEDEAFLTRLRSYLISGKVYSEVSRQIGLPGWVRLGDRHEHLRSRPETHEDVYEAFVGAMFLVFGYPITELWVVRSFEEYTDISDIVRRVINPRERLSNFCITMHGSKPRVEVCRHERAEGGDSFVAKVYHPATDELVAEGHATTSTRAVGDACESAMDVIVSSRGNASSHRNA